MNCLQRQVTLFIALFLLSLRQTASLSNGLGETPAMGWNSWNFFRCNINETLIREVADAIADSGLRDAGYKYVVIDDCWMHKRGPDGRIQPFKDKFPSGMKALADYVHSKGLLFGIYSDTGNKTCEGYPGSWGYEKLDAQTYAEWGVDYLKYDYCGMDQAHESTEASYTRMRDALLATGRPILYSLCSWGAGAPWEWGHKVGNQWRIGIDVFAAWDDAQAAALKLPNFLQPILRAVHAVEPLAPHAAPGGFNDPDMLVVGLDGMYPYGIVKECPEHVAGCKAGDYISRERWGRVGGLTFTEQKTHFAFWCMLASPLILGNDPRHMTRNTLHILTAPELITINQDPLGRQATKIWQKGDHSMWLKELSNGRLAVMLFNAGSSSADITLNFKQHLGRYSNQWEREVPGADPVCTDKLKGCAGWAKAGECERNSGYMLENCQASCPAGCPRPFGPPGPKATALVRDAWQQEDLGPSVALYTALHVEPHQGRVLILKFVEPQQAAEWRPMTMAQKAAALRRGASSSLAVRAAGDSQPDVQPLQDQVAQLKLQRDVCEEVLAEMHSKQEATASRHKMHARQMIQDLDVDDHTSRIAKRPGSSGDDDTPSGSSGNSKQNALVWILGVSNVLLIAVLGVTIRRGRGKKLAVR